MTTVRSARTAWLMTPRDKLILKLLRCCGPVGIPDLARRLQRMFPGLHLDQVATEVAESLATAVHYCYAHVADATPGELTKYDITPLGRTWFDREVMG